MWPAGRVFVTPALDDLSVGRVVAAPVDPQRSCGGSPLRTDITPMKILSGVRGYSLRILCHSLL